MKRVLALILILFLAKTCNLLALPLYLDEGLYIFWAKLFNESPGFAYISMQDGKTPLFIWLTSYLHDFFGDYLFTGRIISVIAGVISAICWLFITSKLTRNSLAYMFVLLLITPYIYLIERIALVDSLLTALGSLSLAFFYLGFLRIKYPWEIFFWFILSGVFLGLAYMTKTSAKVFVLAEILVGIFWALQLIKQKSLVKALYLGGGILLTYITYSQIVGFLKVGSYRFWSQILTKETQLTFSPNEIFNRILHIYDPNIYSVYLTSLGLILQYFITYLGVVFILFFAGLVWIIKKDKKHVWLVVYILSIFLAILLSAKVMASRYLYILVPGIVFIASFGLFWIYNSKQKVIKNLLFLGLVFALFQSLYLVLDPLHALYTKDDKSYLITADLSALGLRESIKIVEDDGGGTVGISGIWGVLEGSQTQFENYGIKTVNVDHWLSKVKPNLEGCDKNQLRVDEEYVRVDFRALEQTSGNKYLFLTRADEDIQVLEKIRKINILKQFQRPNSTNRTYLIKLL